MECKCYGLIASLLSGSSLLVTSSNHIYFEKSFDFKMKIRPNNRLEPVQSIEIQVIQDVNLNDSQNHIEQLLLTGKI